MDLLAAVITHDLHACVVCMAGCSFADIHSECAAGAARGHQIGHLGRGACLHQHSSSALLLSMLLLPGVGGTQHTFVPQSTCCLAQERLWRSATQNTMSCCACIQGAVSHACMAHSMRLPLVSALVERRVHGATLTQRLLCSGYATSCSTC